MADPTNATAPGEVPAASAPAVAARLATIGPLVPQLGREALHRALLPVIERFTAAADDAGAVPDAFAGLEFCRRLFGQARSGDALALAGAIHDYSKRSGDRELARRAGAHWGLLRADTGDYVGAIECHAASLQLAQEEDNAVEASRAWVNIGSAFSAAGNHPLAIAAYRRAIGALERTPGRVFSRYAACLNIAHSAYHLGDCEEGLLYAHLAQSELDDAMRAQDALTDLILHRNFVLLLVAAGRAGEAEPHVIEATRRAETIPGPRAALSAAVTRATWEAATGQTEFALTRLDGALQAARGLPAMMRDTLLCAIRAEEAAGHDAAALLRLEELANLIYRRAVDSAREHAALARLWDEVPPAGEQRTEQDRARLADRLPAPDVPAEWETLERIARGAALRFDPTGRHGDRVGALVQALATACGEGPLQALELGLAARLHDIGMASVPEAIAAKPGALNEVERILWLKHTHAGAEILGGEHHRRLVLAAEMARFHHARYDGTGYPEHVGGTYIPPAARYVAVADACDDLARGEAGTPGCTLEEALGRLAGESGTRFDPLILRCFDALIRGEAEDLGLDLRTASARDGFGDLVQSLQQDRGYA